ncbi:MAG: hypothetical protein AAFQ87_23845, partial [Bacteroidota bacterium]
MTRIGGMMVEHLKRSQKIEIIAHGTSKKVWLQDTNENLLHQVLVFIQNCKKWTMEQFGTDLSIEVVSISSNNQSEEDTASTANVMLLVEFAERIE